MGHGVTDTDTIMLGGNQDAWHGLGSVFAEDVVDREMMLDRANLRWKVSLLPVQVEIPSLGTTSTPSNYFATVREDTGEVLGIVGDRYHVIQNDVAAKFMDDVLMTAKAKYHTAGSLMGGKVVFMMARKPEEIILKGAKEDLHMDFISAILSHDGSLPFSIQAHRTRIVCLNTVRMALAEAKNQAIIKHTETSMMKIEEAQRALGIVDKYFEILTVKSEELIATSFSTKKFENLLHYVMPLPKDKTGAQFEHMEREHLVCKKLWDESPTLKGMEENGYRAVQAIIEWDNHYRKSRESKKSDAAANRFKRIMIKDSSLSTKAMDRILMAAR